MAAHTNRPLNLIEFQLRMAIIFNSLQKYQLWQTTTKTFSSPHKHWVFTGFWRS
jgi:hypothetical protein